MFSASNVVFIDTKTLALTYEVYNNVTEQRRRNTPQRTDKTQKGGEIAPQC